MKYSLLLMILFLLSVHVSAQDRNLGYYLSKALEFSPLLHQAGNQNRIIELDREQTKTILTKPQVNLEAGVLLAPVISHDNSRHRLELATAGAVRYTGYDLALTDGGQYQSVVSVNKPLFTGAGLKTMAYKSEIDRQLNDNTITLTRHELERVVSQQYLVCLKSKSTAETNHQLMADLEEQLELMQKLVENAIYKQSDLMLLRIEYDNFRLSFESAQSEYKSDLFDLNLLCGVNDTTFVYLPDINASLTTDGGAASEFINTYRLDSLTIAAEQAVSDLKYRPQVNLFANAGMNAVYLPDINRLGLSTGITFSWNLYDGHQQKIQRQKTEVSLNNNDFERNNFITQQQLNKKAILDRIGAVQNQIVLTSRQLDNYDDLVKVARAQLSQGEISVIDYKTILRDIAMKKFDLSQLVLQKQALIISYNYWNF